LIAGLLVVAAATQVIACSIPVFRYALENWRPDQYVAYVLHRDSLTDEQKTMVESLQAQNAGGASTANLVVRTIDIAVESKELVRELQDEMTADVWPWLVVQAPMKHGRADTVLSTELAAGTIAGLIDSPARSEIEARLLKGDSVVWVYLESGRQEEDDAAFEQLEQQLAQLETELELPEIEEEDLKDLATTPESLKIQFSALRLSRGNEQESALCDMLLHVEPDLLDPQYADQAMAFPIFGRGRALYALVGDGLAPDLIQEACEFLTGACQCTVKAENPGVDLLMQVEWDRFIQPTEAVDASLPPLAGFSGFGEATDSGSKELLASVTTESQDSSDSSETESDAEPTSADSGQEPVAVSVDDSEHAAEQPTAQVLANSIYAVMLAGFAVVIATLFVMRRTGS